MIEAKADNHERFMRLFLEHEPEILRSVLVFVPDRTDARDIVQETAVALWKHFDDFQADRPFANWACGFARIEVRRFLRQAHRRAVLSERAVEALMVAHMPRSGHSIVRYSSKDGPLEWSFNITYTVHKKLLMSMGIDNMELIYAPALMGHCISAGSTVSPSARASSTLTAQPTGTLTAPVKETKSRGMKITVFLCCLSAAGALGADPASPTPSAQQLEPPSVRSVTPAEWLKAQPKPLFRPGYTLPRLTRYGWVLPTDARIELAESWGYALEFGGYLGEADAARMDDPKSDEAKLAALAKADPKRYPLAVICTRKLPGTEAPPETWTRDKDGKVLNGKAQSMDGTQWSEEKGSIFSPEAPDTVWKLAGEYRAGPLRELQKRGVPISIVLNGGEYGLGVLGFAQPVWSQDPRIVAAVKQTTNGSWRDYASARKGVAEKLIADEVRTAVPQRQLYVYYTAGGRTLRNKDWAIDDWGPQWKHMRGVSDLPSNEIYYRHFNDGFTGRLNLLTIALNAVAAEISTGDPLSYNWICAGWPRGDEKKYMADLDRWTGFLKCYYTAGMIGGNVGFYDFPKGGFAAKFPDDAPPAWLRQMAASAHVHALFSQVEDLVRQSDLLPGPMRHEISSADPAYEFPTGDETARVLGRKHRSKAEWLLTAWASDGLERAVKVRVPELGRLTLRARPCGSVYRAVLKNGAVTLTQLDEEGSTFTKAPTTQSVTAPVE